jgi:hypothetical protein
MNKIILILLTLCSLNVFSSPFVKPSEPNGMLIFNVSHSTEDVFPVSLYSIDGKQVLTRNNAVWLSPGKHTIRVNSKIDLTGRSAVVTARKKNNSKNKAIEIDVKEGKKYYVGYDASDDNSNNWQPIVWKVK